MKNSDAARISMKRYDEFIILEGRVKLLVEAGRQEKYLSKETIFRCLGIEISDDEPV